MRYPGARQRKRRTQTAGIGSPRIVLTVNMQHGNCPSFAWGRYAGSGHRGDGRNPLRQFIAETVCHHPAIRVPGDVNPSRIDGCPALDVIKQGGNELDIVHATGLGIATAIAGVPREQVFVQATGAIGIDDHVSIPVGRRIHSSALAMLPGIAAATMQAQDNRQWLTNRLMGYMDQVTAASAAGVDFEVVIASSEFPCPSRPGRP